MKFNKSGTSPQEIILMKEAIEENSEKIETNTDAIEAIEDELVRIPQPWAPDTLHKVSDNEVYGELGNGVDEIMFYLPLSRTEESQTATIALSLLAEGGIQDELQVQLSDFTPVSASDFRNATIKMIKTVYGYDLICEGTAMKTFPIEITDMELIKVDITCTGAFAQTSGTVYTR